jgi:CRP-like cAMP-binding protein
VDRLKFEPFGREFFSGKKKDEDKRVKLLKNCELFENISQSILEKLAELLHERKFEKDEVIFSQDEPASAMFLIESGKVLIYREGSGDEKQELATLEKQDFFGELAICEDHKRTASAVAIEETKIQVLFRQEFLKFAHRNIEHGFKILLNLARMVGRKLRDVNHRYYKLFEKIELVEKENEVETEE